MDFITIKISSTSYLINSLIILIRLPHNTLLTSMTLYQLSTFVVMTSSYNDSVFLYLVNSRHTCTSIIIIREILIIIMLIGSIIANSILLRGILSGVEEVVKY